MALAEGIRAKRQIDIINGAYGFLSERNLKTCFVEYGEEIAAKRTGSINDGWAGFLL